MTRPLNWRARPDRPFVEAFDRSVDLRDRGYTGTDQVLEERLPPFEFRGQLLIRHSGPRGKRFAMLRFRQYVEGIAAQVPRGDPIHRDRKSTRLSSSHSQISYAVFC